MDTFRETLLVMITTPVYIILIYVHDKKYYTVKDTATNVYLSTLNFLLDLALRGVGVIVLNYFFQFRVMEIGNVFAYWFTLLVLQDILYYFLHRVDHFCRF